MYGSLESATTDVAFQSQRNSSPQEPFARLNQKREGDLPSDQHRAAAEPSKKDPTGRVQFENAFCIEPHLGKTNAQFGYL